MPDDAVGEHLSSGRLVAVLEDWSPSHPGYHATRNSFPAMGLMVEALRQVTCGD